MPDIFDQIHAHVSGAATPTGDIFDQIHAAASQPQTVNIPTAAGANAQLTPEQAQRYYRELQATPLNANPPQQGALDSFGHAVLRPFTGMAGLGMHLVAGKVGDINTEAGQGIEQAAQNTYNFGNNTAPGVTEGLTGIGTGAGMLAAGPVGAAASAANVFGNRIYGDILHEQEGLPVDDDSILHAIAAAGVDWTLNRLMQSGITSDAAKAAIARLAPKLGQTAATVGARSVMGGGLMGGGQVINNAINNRPLTENVIAASGQGALMENLAGALQGEFNRPPPAPAPTPVTEIPLKPESPLIPNSVMPSRPLLTPQPGETNAQIVDRAGATGYDTDPLQNKGRRPLLTALDEQRLKQNLPISNRIAATTETENLKNQAQLPPEGTSWDAGQLNKFARDNGYTVDRRRVQIDVERGIAPRDAIRSQIEEQQTGVGPTGKIESNADIAAKATLAKPPEAQPPIPVERGSYLLKGEEPPVSGSVRPTEFPLELPDAKSVGEFARTKLGEANSTTIEALANTAPGKYVLRDVPVDSVQANDLMGDETNPQKVAKYAAMPSESRPPVILGKNGEMFDGGHRLAAAKANGETTIKAYVPESFGQVSESKNLTPPIETATELSPSAPQNQVKFPKLRGETDAQYAERIPLTISAQAEEEAYSDVANTPVEKFPPGPPETESLIRKFLDDEEGGTRVIPRLVEMLSPQKAKKPIENPIKGREKPPAIEPERATLPKAETPLLLAKTGTPITIRGTRHFETDTVEPRGGYFYSPTAKSEFGSKSKLATVHLENPLVVKHQFDAVRELVPFGSEQINLLNDLYSVQNKLGGHGSNKEILADPELREKIRRLDQTIADKTKILGHDGIVYKDDDSFVVFKKPLEETRQASAQAEVEAEHEISNTPTANVPPDSPEIKGYIDSFLANEEGGSKAAGAFAKRVVVPQAKNLFGRLRETVKNLSDFFGAGVADTEEQASTKGEVRSMTGDMDRRKAAWNDQLMPARNDAEKMPQGQRDSLVDDLGSGKSLPTPALQKASDSIKRAQESLKVRAAAIGEDVSGWTDDHIGRLFVDKETGKLGGQRSIAGPEGYRKAPQKYDTFAEAKAAADKLGLKPLYDNPVEMAFAKIAEADHSISARELVDQKVKSGDISEIKAGQKIPDGYGYLDDKLARRGANRLVAPEAVADTFNQMIAQGLKPGLPILDSIIKLKQATAAMNFSLSAWHIPTVTTRNLGMQIGLAMNNLFHGEFDLAGMNLRRALPHAAANFGGEVRAAAEKIGQAGPLEPLIQAANEAGHGFGGRNMLQPTAWEKMVRAYKAGDVISAGGHFIKSIGEALTGPIMDKFVPNVKASYVAAQAETAIRRGLKGDDLHSYMLKAVDNANNVLGRVIRSNQFQHQVVQDLMDGLFSAPKFAEGDIRWGSATVRDTLNGIRDLATGKKPTLTPAMQTAIGHTIAVATAGAATQLAWTYATTGKMAYPKELRDFFMPKTGRQNDDGSDERIMLPTGFSLFTSLATEGPTKTVENRIAPIFRAMYDVATNSDYRNRQVYDPNAGAGTRIKQGVTHVAKSALPFSVQSMVERPNTGEQTADITAAGFAGIRKASPRLSESDAEALAHKYSFENVPPRVRTPEESDRYDLKRKIESGLRKHDPKVNQQINDAVRSKQLTREDVADARKRSTEETGLVGLMKHGNLTVDQSLEVWDKATPEERKSIRWIVRGKIGRDDRHTEEEKQAFFKRVSA